MASIILPGTADPSKVLSGQTFSAGPNFNAAGTMPNQGAVALTPSGGGALTIPAGYHNGLGTVAQVNVPAANVLTGTNIAGVAGTMPNRSGSDQNGLDQIYSGNTIGIRVPAGYYDGNKRVNWSDPNFDPSNIRAGATIFGMSGSGSVKRSASGTINLYVDGNQNFTINNLSFTPSKVIITGPQGFYGNVQNRSPVDWLLISSTSDLDAGGGSFSSTGAWDGYHGYGDAGHIITNGFATDRLIQSAISAGSTGAGYANYHWWAFE
jgi:hypothetical protein